MPAQLNLFRLLNEFIVLLLGALLVLLAATRRMALPEHPGVLIVLGFVFVFWAARAWARPAPGEGRLLTVVRAGSLGVVGILLIAIPLLELRRANMLIEVAGIVLVVRGLICAGLSSFRSEKQRPSNKEETNLRLDTRNRPDQKREDNREG